MFFATTCPIAHQAIVPCRIVVRQNYELFICHFGWLGGKLPCFPQYTLAVLDSSMQIFGNTVTASQICRYLVIR
jgi:hypothetical protein